MSNFVRVTGIAWIGTVHDIVSTTALIHLRTLPYSGQQYTRLCDTKHHIFYESGYRSLRISIFKYV